MSGAAERLRASVSSLSHHLSNLEHELGVQLFERRRRGMVPTADGERFIGHAREILRVSAAAEADMREGGRRVAGQVSVSLTSSATKAIGFALISQCLGAYPDLTLALRTGLSSSVIADVVEHRGDLGLAYNADSIAGLRAEPLLEETMVLVGTAELIGETGDPIPFDAVLDMPLILLTQGLSARALARDRRRLRLLEETARLQVDSVETIEACLRAGLGATVGTALIFPTGASGQGLHSRPIVDPTLDRRLYLLEPAERPRTHAVEAVRAIAVDLIRRSLRSGRWPAAAI